MGTLTLDEERLKTIVTDIITAIVPDMIRRAIKPLAADIEMLKDSVVRLQQDSWAHTVALRELRATTTRIDNRTIALENDVKEIYFMMHG